MYMGTQGASARVLRLARPGWMYWTSGLHLHAHFQESGVHSRTFLAIGLLEGQDGDADLPAGPVPSVKAGGKNIFRLLDIGGSDQIDLCKSPVSYSNWHDLLLVSSASHCVTVSVEWCDNKGPLLRKTEQLQEAALKGMLTERSSTALTPSQCCATLFSSRCSKPLSR